MIPSHMRSSDPLEPPTRVNHSVKVMSSSSLTMSIPPSKSTNARTMGEVPSRSWGGGVGGVRVVGGCQAGGD